MVFVESVLGGKFPMPVEYSGYPNEGREHDEDVHLPRLESMPELHAKMAGILAFEAVHLFTRNINPRVRLARQYVRYVDIFLGKAWNRGFIVDPINHQGRVLYELQHGQSPSRDDFFTYRDDFMSSAPGF